MKKILVLAIFLLFPALVLATQWGSPELCPGVNDSYDNFSTSILTNGTIFQVGQGHNLFKNGYLGSYQWETPQECSAPTTVRTITIDPEGSSTAIVADGASYDVKWASSSDNGLSWTWDDIITGWNRNPNYVVSVSCAWESGEKWLYVVYSDNKLYAAAYPYDNPQYISSLGSMSRFGVRPTGGYAVVTHSDDLWETVGYGDSWSALTKIDEVSSPTDEETSPVVWKLDSKNILLFARNSDEGPGGYDVWYSIGDSTASIQPTSLGSVKAMFK